MFKLIQSLPHRFLPYFFTQRKLRKFLQAAEPERFTVEALVTAFHVSDLSAIEHLLKRSKREVDALLSSGKLSSDCHRTLTQVLRAADPLLIAQKLSPTHALLSEKDFYRLSDPPTRRLLRRSFARFAIRHRLDSASAALLWKGEGRPPRRIGWILVLFPLLLVAIAGWVGITLLPISAFLLLCLTLPAIFTGGYLLFASLLRKLLPEAPVPLLENSTGYSVLTVWVTGADTAETAIRKAYATASETGMDCPVVLILPSETSAVTPRAEILLDRLHHLAEDLSARIDASVVLLPLPCKCRPQKFAKFGRSDAPSLSDLAKALLSYLSTLPVSPDAVTVLPADGAILPGGVEGLAAALFHPLCTSEALVFHTPASSPLPLERLTVLRQCLLQKFARPIDLCGWGIYRIEALHRLAQGETISTQLSAQPLYTDSGQFPTPLTIIRQTPTLLTGLKLLLPFSRALLLLGIVATSLPVSLCLLLWTMASVDLLSAFLLSLRLNRRFILYTIPAGKRLGIALLERTFLPIRSVCRAIDWLELPKLCLLSLAFGTAVIAIGLPLSALGLFWAVAPLLLTESKHKTALNPVQRGACYALATELSPYLREFEKTLPPAYLTETGEYAPYTTPAVLGSFLAAEVALCDLGMIDPYTLERRIDRLIGHLETLPTRCGLPYARYHVQTGEFYRDSRVDTATVGLYALCLAAAESGLDALAVRHAPLGALARRIAHLEAQMDLTILLRDDLTLCRQLSPSGEQEGILACLTDGGITLFALLSSDSARGLTVRQKLTLQNILCSPIKLYKGSCIYLSESGSLSDYLLLSHLLPTPQGSLIRDASRRAFRMALREGRRKARQTKDPMTAEPPAAAAVKQQPNSFHATSLLNWPHLSDSPRPLAAGCDALSLASGHVASEPSAFPFCLLLAQRPRFALSHLRKLQRSSPSGGFTDPAHPDRIPLDRLALSLIALAGAIGPDSFAHHLSKLPRFHSLSPLLCRRPDSAIDRLPCAPVQPSASVCANPQPSIYLLGDASNALLIARGQGICLWKDGIPLTAPSSPCSPMTGGKGSGLLLCRAGNLLDLPDSIYRRETGRLTLRSPKDQCQIIQSANGWMLVWDRTDTEPTEIRFLFCPSLPSAHLQEQIRANAACLQINYSSALTLFVTVEGIESPFTHADPSPFPQGAAGLRSIFSIAPVPAIGTFSTPSCMIGGQLCGKRLTVQLTFSPTADLAKTETTSTCAYKKFPLPLPVPDCSLASRVLEWQIASLFAASPIPSAMATGGAGNDGDYLARCLEGGRQLLLQKGFPQSSGVPIPLSVNRREGAEAVIHRLLTAVPEEVETVLLPAEGSIVWQDGFPRILRSRNNPPPLRHYSNGICSLSADPNSLEFLPQADARPISLTLRLKRGNRTLLLPAAATSVIHGPSEIHFEGEAFAIRAALLPRLPLLVIALHGEGERTLCATNLPPLCHEENGEQFYSLSNGRLLFIRQLEDQEQTVWLMGTFPRGRDRLYYFIRNTVTLQTLPHLLADADFRLRAAASLLRIEEKVPTLPSIASVVLEAPSPARALLTPLCLPNASAADLIRLAKAPPSLLFPMALAIRVAVTDETVARWRIPVEGGRASLYLLAARCLEQAMEEAPHHPLLSPLVASFARLADRLGDHAGKQLYSEFSSNKPTAPSDWNPLPEASAQTIAVLADLSQGKTGAVRALLEALHRLPLSPVPADAALLWSGLLWGVLGFTPSALGDGFTLAPLSVEEEITVRLSYRGEWQIHLSPNAAPICSRADLPTPPDTCKRQKNFRKRKFSLQNGCIVHKNSVK